MTSLQIWRTATGNHNCTNKKSRYLIFCTNIYNNWDGNLEYTVHQNFETSVDAGFSKYIKIQWTYFLADLCIRWKSNNEHLETFNCLSNNVMHQLHPEGQSSMENP
jgi:hypothetical protein